MVVLWEEGEHSAPAEIQKRQRTESKVRRIKSLNICLSGVIFFVLVMFESKRFFVRCSGEKQPNHSMIVDDLRLLGMDKILKSVKSVRVRRDVKIILNRINVLCM